MTSPRSIVADLTLSTIGHPVACLCSDCVELADLCDQIEVERERAWDATRDER